MLGKKFDCIAAVAHLVELIPKEKYFIIEIKPNRKTEDKLVIDDKDGGDVGDDKDYGLGKGNTKGRIQLKILVVFTTKA